MTKIKQDYDIVYAPGAIRNFNGIAMNRYVGLTYPRFLTWPIWRRVVFYLWKRFFCTKHIHLFDEMLSSEHVLICDACELSVHIAHIETSEEACARAEKGLYIETSSIEKSELDSTHCVRLK